jgi:hypothetical protein
MQQRRQGEAGRRDRVGGSSTQAASDNAVVGQRAALQPGGAFSCRPGSADIVKAGITRPAITHSIITISAKPACSARSGSMLSQPSAAA